MSKDQDHRRTATHVLFTANKVVTTERGGQHGGAEDSFQMIADLWATYLNNTNHYSELKITPKDVAQMMVLLKIARNVHGQLKEDDFVDQAGYTGLAAALAGIKAPDEVAVVEPARVVPPPGSVLLQTPARVADDPPAPPAPTKLKPVTEPPADNLSQVLKTLEKEITPNG